MDIFISTVGFLLIAAITSLIINALAKGETDRRMEKWFLDQWKKK